MRREASTSDEKWGSDADPNRTSKGKTLPNHKDRGTQHPPMQRSPQSLFLLCQSNGQHSWFVDPQDRQEKCRYCRIPRK